MRRASLRSFRAASGDLAMLDLAFSRDQAEKIYVQDRLRESWYVDVYDDVRVAAVSWYVTM